jgi:hypothetical protein
MVLTKVSSLQGQFPEVLHHDPWRGQVRADQQLGMVVMKREAILESCPNDTI